MSKKNKKLSKFSTSNNYKKNFKKKKQLHCEKN